jgi:hypothetical protein
MSTPVTPVDWADRAAEAVRGLNHATIRGGYVWPSDVDAVVGRLESLAIRLPQALDQAARWLRHEHAAGRVGYDTTADVNVAVGDALAGLDAAARKAVRLRTALSAVRVHTGHLTGVGGDSGE